MEAHHPHHLTHKKKWTEYLLEFFMLFFAVFLGFIAENIREHLVETRSVKGLITSLITDLQKDTSTINWLENFRDNKRNVRLDSFYQLINTPTDQIDKKSYYRLLKSINEHYAFIQSNATIEQLKNAGYLRYFSDSRLLNYISDYAFVIQDYKGDENIELSRHYELMHLLKQNADNNDMYSNYIEMKLPEGTGIKPFAQEVLQSIKAYLIEAIYFNHLIMKLQNNRVKLKAIELMDYLHKTYNIK